MDFLRPVERTRNDREHLARAGYIAGRWKVDDSSECPIRDPLWSLVAHDARDGYSHRRGSSQLV